METRRPLGPERGMHAARGLLWLLLAVTPACSLTVSPQPEPVCLAAPDLDPERMRFESSAQGTVLVGQSLSVGTRACGGGGEGGLAEPTPGAVLHAVNLDSQSPEVNAPVGPHGSFEIALPGAPTDVYRLQVTTPDIESLFFDVTSSADDVVVVTPCLGRPLVGFPDVSPGQPVVLDVELSNECDSAVAITGAALRLGDQGFAIVDDPVTTVAEPEAPVTVRVRFEAATGGAHEDILLIHFTAGAEARTAITLRATSAD